MEHDWRDIDDYNFWCQRCGCLHNAEPHTYWSLPGVPEKYDEEPECKVSSQEMIWDLEFKNNQLKEEIDRLQTTVFSYLDDNRKFPGDW